MFSKNQIQKLSSRFSVVVSFFTVPDSTRKLFKKLLQVKLRPFSCCGRGF